MAMLNNQMVYINDIQIRSETKTSALFKLRGVNIQIPNDIKYYPCLNLTATQPNKTKRSITMSTYADQYVCMHICPIVWKHGGIFV